MSSLIRRLEDVENNNDIITPDSSDFDEDTPTHPNSSSPKIGAVETVIEVEEKNEILPAPLEIPAYKEDEIAIDISGNN